jgi:hypothetical protein
MGKKGIGEITILSAVDELQRCFKFFNEKFFDGKLPRPVIAVSTDHTGGAYGWITLGKVWSDKSGEWHREINVTAEHLNRPVVEVIVTLLHEMCHLFNIENNVQDCSRGGTYHNAKFRDVAVKVGLMVGKHKLYGHCITTAGEELTALINSNVRAGCFKLEREKVYKNGMPKITVKGEDGKEKTISRAKQSMRKFHCPMCGFIIRATKDIGENILCVPCDALFCDADESGTPLES